MIFGWRKKETVPIEAAPKWREITLLEVPQAVSDLEQLRSSTLVREVRSTRLRILSEMDRLLGMIRSIDGESMKTEDMDRHLRSIVSRGKKQTVSVIRAEAGRSFVDVSSVEDVRTFVGAVGKSIKKMGDVLGRHTRVVHVFAKKHTNKLKEVLSALDADREDLLRMVREYDIFRDGTASMRSLLDKISESEGAKSEKLEKAEFLRREAVDIGAKISCVDSDISGILQSEEYVAYSKRADELAEMRPEEDRIRREIESQFTRISRPLGKYTYVSSLDREHKNLLDTMTARPADAMRSASKDMMIAVLMAVRRGVISGSVSVKDQMKAVSQIDETVEMLDGFIVKFARYDDRRKSLREEMGRFDTTRLDRLREDIEALRSDRDHCSERAQASESEAGEMTAQRDAMVLELERLLCDVSSVRYHIL